MNYGAEALLLAECLMIHERADEFPLQKHAKEATDFEALLAMETSSYDAQIAKPWIMFKLSRMRLRFAMRRYKMRYFNTILDLGPANLR